MVNLGNRQNLIRLFGLFVRDDSNLMDSFVNTLFRAGDGNFVTVIIGLVKKSNKKLIRLTVV